MAITYFLAQLIGYYLLIFGVLVLFRKRASMAAIDEMCRSKAWLFILGLIITLLGLLMVLTHNYWSDGHLALLVTIIGWLTLLKGVALLFVPQQTIALWVKWSNFEKISWLYAIVVIVIGLYLLHGGITQTGLLG